MGYGKPLEATIVRLRRAKTALEQAEKIGGEYAPWEEIHEAKQLVEEAIEELEY